ncbi:MAG: transposase [Candidatus Aminicenantes bacterium]|nr:transposase [Acidobacteriota bacterium]MCG2810275.1 transposase [Candidatus Aminicenantes bacterium]
MNISFYLSDNYLESAAIKPFVLFRDCVRPAIEARRQELNAMYAQVLGRPEIDPVFLIGVLILQMMERLPDRQAITACWYDARWRLALGISEDWAGIDPSVLVYFRHRLAKHQLANVALEAGLTAMRSAGYLRRHCAVRIDSTHVLAHIAHMSRLDCVRETLRLALDFLAAFGGSAAWEPWFSRYVERHSQDFRNTSGERLRATMVQAGRDMREVLTKTQAIGDAVIRAEPVALLQRVFNEQFEITEGDSLQKRTATSSGIVCNPHDPDAEWSTKDTLGKAGWIGYKLQVCETAPENTRQPGEPTEAAITAVLTQPAITSDHGSLTPVIIAHEQNGQAKPTEAFADAGYLSAPALEAAKANGYVLTGPIGAPPHSGERFGSDVFVVDIPNRQATCPSGKLSMECHRITETKIQKTYYNFAWAQTDCTMCPLKGQCLSKKKRHPFRTLKIAEKHMVVQERRNLCKTHEYQQRMHRRSGIEGTHSELTRGYKLRWSRYRGLNKTDIQMQFTVAACNLRRWAVRLCWLRRQETMAVA